MEIQFLSVLDVKSVMMILALFRSGFKKKTVSSAWVGSSLQNQQSEIRQRRIQRKWIDRCWHHFAIFKMIGYVYIRSGTQRDIRFIIIGWHHKRDLHLSSSSREDVSLFLLLATVKTAGDISITILWWQLDGKKKVWKNLCVIEVQKKRKDATPIVIIVKIPQSIGRYPLK